jgi:hypothetical protein
MSKAFLLDYGDIQATPKDDLISKPIGSIEIDLEPRRVKGDLLTDVF